MQIVGRCIPFLTLLILLSGCQQSFGPDRGALIVPLNQENHSALSGSYDNGNHPDSPGRGFLLITELTDDAELTDPYRTASQIQLTARPDGLLVTFENKGESDSIFLEGQYQDGYLRLDRQRTLKRAAPLLYGYGRKDVRVGRLKTGELIVDRRASGCLQLIVLPIFCSGDRVYSTPYQPIRDETNP